MSRIRERFPYEPIGATSDLSLFVGGSDLTVKSAKMKSPISIGTRIAIEEPPHPFRTQKIAVEGMNPQFRSNTEKRLHNQKYAPRIPKPYPIKRFATWKPITKPIATIPSVIVGGGKLQYPMRSLSPQQRYLENFPMLCGIRRKINAFVRG